MKWNMGCGNDKQEGYINTDTDLNLDVLPYPFPNNHFDEILAKNVMEHLTLDTDQLMKELHRILKPGGVLRIRVPHYTNPASHYTQHKKEFSSKSFDGYMSYNAYNRRCYPFGFIKLEKVIDFPKGLMFWNHIIEWLANINILHYETTPLNILPAKGMWFELIK